jgi:hypothetical protein
MSNVDVVKINSFLKKKSQLISPLLSGEGVLKIFGPLKVACHTSRVTQIR